MIGVFVQVRLDSNRLPEKALLDLAGRPLIGHVMQALSGVPAEVHALVSEERSAAVLEPLAEEYGFALFSGDPEDVLRRYADAVRHFGVDTVVRATGDNPLVSARLVREILQLHEERAADLSGFDDLPLGTGVEILSREALLRADARAVDPYEREHVSPYLYRHPDRFRILRTPAPEPYRLPEGRVTVDTPEDYQYVRQLMYDLYQGIPVEIGEVVQWIAGAQAGNIRRMA